LRRDACLHGYRLGVQHGARQRACRRIERRHRSNRIGHRCRTFDRDESARRGVGSLHGDEPLRLRRGYRLHGCRLHFFGRRPELFAHSLRALHGRCDCHRQGIDAGVDNRCGYRTTGLVEYPIAGALADFGEFFEWVHHGSRCRLSHFAAWLVGQRAANLVHHVGGFGISEAQRLSGYRAYTGEASRR
jgi:hypothetical protein